jgi:hypothetical protein
MRWTIAESVGPATRVALLELLAGDVMENEEVRAMAFERAERVLGLVHRVLYRADLVGEEAFEDVCDTLAHGGDCEELAVLFVAIARNVGLEARVVWLDQQIHGSALKHVFARSDAVSSANTGMVRPTV